MSDREGLRALPQASLMRRARFCRAGTPDQVGVDCCLAGGIFVVEHKAQTHIGCFALVSRLGCAVSSDAPLYFRRGPFASRFKAACEGGNRLTKAQKA